MEDDKIITSDGTVYDSEDEARADGYVQCADCGKWVQRDDARYADGEYYCEDCFFDTYQICDECGEAVRIDDLIPVYSSAWARDRGDVYCYVCQECADNEYYYCDGCDCYYTSEAVTDIGDYDCTWRCDGCIDHYAYCDGCRRWVYEDDYDFDEELCYECARNRGSDKIGDYHDRPRLVKFGKGTGKYSWRGIGIELEVDRDERDSDAEIECVDAIDDLAGDEVYYNRDGSLHNGFEIITQPHTLDAFYAMPWGDILQACIDNGYKSHDAGTCGLHVHISREAFGSTQDRQDRAIGKLIKFYDTFYNEIVKVSRRDRGRAIQWASPYYTTDNNEAKKAGKCKCNGRYYAVNNTNRDTVEIRIMRGTLKLSTFLACIDFAVTTARNAKRIRWEDVGDASKWLKGLKQDTIEYIKQQHAFEGVI